MSKTTLVSWCWLACVGLAGCSGGSSVTSGAAAVSSAGPAVPETGSRVLAVPPPEQLVALAREALVAVQAHFPAEPFAEHVGIEVVPRDALAAAIERDREALVSLRSTAEEASSIPVSPAADLGLADGALASETPAHTTLAYFTHSASALLICAENLEFAVRELGRHGLADPLVLRALFAHEVTHARDRKRFDVAAGERVAKGTDRRLGQASVYEGHAQLVARAVCAQNGWSAGFEALRSTLSRMPVDTALDSGLEIAVRAATRAYSVCCRGGEDFVRALSDAGGDELIARAFADPPASPTVVAHPSWYLDSRPERAAIFAPDSALDLFEELEGGSGRQMQRMDLALQQIRPTLAGLSQRDLTRLEHGLLDARMGIIRDSASTGSMRAAGLYELANAGEAYFALAVQATLQRRRDAAHRDGPMRITRAEYQDLDLPGDLHGWLAQKTIETRGVPAEVSTLLLASGHVLLELSITDDPPAPEQLLEVGRRVLEAALGLERVDTALSERD